MAVQYLGKVNGIITTESLSTLTGITGGTILQSGDITWLHFKKDGKVLLVADRNIKSTISWNTLNASGCIAGKQISINGNNCNCRVLTGGNADPSSSAGGEWDGLIVNFVPKDIDSNWSSYFTICKEKSSFNSSAHIFRGKEIRYYGDNYGISSAYSDAGWRPVLEFINTIPSINYQSDYGENITPPTINYSVTDIDNNSFSITEKLDGNIIRTLTNQISGTNYTLNISLQWDSLSYGNHTIQVIADDGKFLGQSIATIKFYKAKNHTSPIQTTSLDGLINHFDSVSKDYDYERFRLSENLITKGVTATKEEKLSALVDKVKNIDKSIVFKEGRDFYIDLTLYPLKTHNNIGEESSTYTKKLYTFLNRGTVTFSFELMGWSNTVYAKSILRLYNKNLTLLESSKTFAKQGSTSGFLICEQTFNVEIGDSVIYDGSLSEGGPYRNMRIYYNK